MVVSEVRMMQINRWTQLDLFPKPRPVRAVDFPRNAAPSTEDAHRQRIVGFLSFHLPAPVDLVFTNNRSTMISFAHRQGRYQVRLHRLFRHADEAVLNALARFILGRKSGDSGMLDRFIADHKDEIRASRQSRPRILNEVGNHHNLSRLLKRVADTYFDGRADVRIGWSRLPRRRRTSRRRRHTVSRALATYSYEDRTIRVSPVLDAANVPIYVMEWIIYHEMLHHVLPVKRVGGKNQYHTAQFRALERAFKDFERAKKWETSHLEQLLR